MNNMSEITKIDSITIAKPFNQVSVRMTNYEVIGEREIMLGGTSVEFAPSHSAEPMIDTLGLRALVTLIWDADTTTAWNAHLAINKTGE